MTGYGPARRGRIYRKRLKQRPLSVSNEHGTPRIRVVLRWPDGREHPLMAYCELHRNHLGDRARFTPAMIARAVAFGRSLEQHDLCGQPRTTALRLGRVETGYGTIYDPANWTTAWTPAREAVDRGSNRKTTP